MAYGLKYLIEFETYVLKQVYKVEIYEDGHTGTALEPLMSSTPAILKTDSSDFIRGRSLQLNLVSESNYQYINLFSSDWRKFNVKLYRIFAGVPELAFDGYILPEHYFEPYQAAPYVVSFTAVDSVAMLKNINISALTATGQIAQLKLIFLILDQISTLRKIKTRIPFWATQMTNTVSPLAQAYLDIEFYKAQNLSLYDVLEDVLKVYNAFIMQSGDAWIIANKTDLNPFTNLLIYAFDGTNVNTAGNIDINAGLLNIGYNTALNFSLELAAPKKSVNIRHDLSPLASLIPLADFSKPEAWTGSPVSLAGWTASAYIQMDQMTELNGNTYLRMWPALATGRYIETNLAPEVYTTYDLQQNLKVIAKSNTLNSATDIEIGIFYKSGADVYWYDFSAEAWVYSTLKTKVISWPASYSFSEQSTGIKDEPPFLTGGYYGARIYADPMTFINIQSVSLAPAGIPEEVNSTVQIVSTAINTAPDVVVYFADLKISGMSRADQYYINLLRTSAGAYLSDWDGAGASLLERLGADLVTYYTPIKKILRGSAIIDDPNIEFLTFDSIRFEILEAEHDLVYDRANLTIQTAAIQ